MNTNTTKPRINRKKMLLRHKGVSEVLTLLGLDE